MTCESCLFVFVFVPRVVCDDLRVQLSLNVPIYLFAMARPRWSDMIETPVEEGVLVFYNLNMQQELISEVKKHPGKMSLMRALGIKQDIWPLQHDRCRVTDVRSVGIPMKLGLSYRDYRYEVIPIILAHYRAYDWPLVCGLVGGK